MKGIILEIASQEVQNRSGVSKRTGNSYSINEQTAFLHKPGQPYPDKIKITLGDNQPPYALGNYSLHSDSFFVDRFGALAVRPILIARPAETKQQPTAQAVKAG